MAAGLFSTRTRMAMMFALVAVMAAVMGFLIAVAARDDDSHRSNFNAGGIFFSYPGDDLRSVDFDGFSTNLEGSYQVGISPSKVPPHYTYKRNVYGTQVAREKPNQRTFPPDEVGGSQINYVRVTRRRGRVSRRQYPRHATYSVQCDWTGTDARPALEGCSQILSTFQALESG